MQKKSPNKHHANNSLLDTSKAAVRSTSSITGNVTQSPNQCQQQYFTGSPPLARERLLISPLSFNYFANGMRFAEQCPYSQHNLLNLVCDDHNNIGNAFILNYLLNFAMPRLL